MIRAQNQILLRWSWPRIKRERRETKSECRSERADVLSWLKLIATQGSSIQLLVCVEFWGLLSIFPRVSWKQLLQHYGLWRWLWSVSWDKSLTYGLLDHNRGTDCFWAASYAHYQSTCHCWPAWKRYLLVENWVVS